MAGEAGEHHTCQKCWYDGCADCGTDFLKLSWSPNTAIRSAHRGRGKPLHHVVEDSALKAELERLQEILETCERDPQLPKEDQNRFLILFRNGGPCAPTRAVKPEDCLPRDERHAMYAALVRVMREFAPPNKGHDRHIGPLRERGLPPELLDTIRGSEFLCTLDDRALRGPEGDRPADPRPLLPDAAWELLPGMIEERGVPCVPGGPSWRGIWIPALDADQRIMGGQVKPFACHQRSDVPKYSTLGAKRKVPCFLLPELDMCSPNFVWVPRDMDACPERRRCLGLTEGGLKSLIAAAYLQIPVFGAGIGCGGVFTDSVPFFKEALDRLRAQFDTDRVVFFPDAGCLANPQVAKHNAETLLMVRETLGVEPMVAWWPWLREPPKQSAAAQQNIDDFLSRVTGFRGVQMLSAFEFWRLQEEVAGQPDPDGDLVARRREAWAAVAAAVPEAQRRKHVRPPLEVLLRVYEPMADAAGLECSEPFPPNAPALPPARLPAPRPSLPAVEHQPAARLPVPAPSSGSAQPYNGEHGLSAAPPANGYHAVPPPPALHAPLHRRTAPLVLAGPAAQATNPQQPAYARQLGYSHHAGHPQPAPQQAGSLQQAPFPQQAANPYAQHPRAAPGAAPAAPGWSEARPREPAQPAPRAPAAPAAGLLPPPARPLPAAAPAPEPPRGPPAAACGSRGGGPGTDIERAVRESVREYEEQKRAREEQQRLEQQAIQESVALAESQRLYEEEQERRAIAEAEERSLLESSFPEGDGPGGAGEAEMEKAKENSALSAVEDDYVRTAIYLSQMDEAVRRAVEEQAAAPRRALGLELDEDDLREGAPPGGDTSDEEEEEEEERAPPPRRSWADEVDYESPAPRSLAAFRPAAVPDWPAARPWRDPPRPAPMVGYDMIDVPGPARAMMEKLGWAAGQPLGRPDRPAQLGVPDVAPLAVRMTERGVNNFDRRGLGVPRPPPRRPQPAPAPAHEEEDETEEESLSDGRRPPAGRAAQPAERPPASSSSSSAPPPASSSSSSSSSSAPPPAPSLSAAAAFPTPAFKPAAPPTSETTPAAAHSRPAAAAERAHACGSSCACCASLFALQAPFAIVREALRTAAGQLLLAELQAACAWLLSVAWLLDVAPPARPAAASKRPAAQAPAPSPQPASKRRPPARASPAPAASPARPLSAPVPDEDALHASEVVFLPPRFVGHPKPHLGGRAFRGYRLLTRQPLEAPLEPVPFAPAESAADAFRWRGAVTLRPLREVVLSRAHLAPLRALNDMFLPKEHPAGLPVDKQNPAYGFMPRHAKQLAGSAESEPPLLAPRFGRAPAGEEDDEEDDEDVQAELLRAALAHSRAQEDVVRLLEEQDSGGEWRAQARDLLLDSIVAVEHTGFKFPVQAVELEESVRRYPAMHRYHGHRQSLLEYSLEKGREVAFPNQPPLVSREHSGARAHLVPELCSVPTGITASMYDAAGCLLDCLVALLRRSAAAAVLQKMRVDAGLGDAPFRRPDLIAAAMRHSSARAAPEAGREADNERLEFLGDRVAGYAVRRALALGLPGLPAYELTLSTQTACRNRVFAQAAAALGLDEALERATELTENIRADAFEALAGALFLSEGLDAARRFVLRALFFQGEVDAGLDPLRLRQLQQVLREGDGGMALRLVPTLSERGGSELERKAAAGLCPALQHTFAEPALLSIALRRGEFTARRLACLGKAALHLCAAAHLFHAHPSEPPGGLQDLFRVAVQAGPVMAAYGACLPPFFIPEALALVRHARGQREAGHAERLRGEEALYADPSELEEAVAAVAGALACEAEPTPGRFPRCPCGLDLPGGLFHAAFAAVHRGRLEAGHPERAAHMAAPLPGWLEHGMSAYGSHVPAFERPTAADEAEAREALEAARAAASRQSFVSGGMLPGSSPAPAAPGAGRGAASQSPAPPRVPAPAPPPPAAPSPPAPAAPARNPAPPAPTPPSAAAAAPIPPASPRLAAPAAPPAPVDRPPSPAWDPPAPAPPPPAPATAPPPPEPLEAVLERARAEAERLKTALTARTLAAEEAALGYAAGAEAVRRAAAAAGETDLALDCVELEARLALNAAIVGRQAAEARAEAAGRQVQAAWAERWAKEAADLYENLGEGYEARASKVPRLGWGGGAPASGGRRGTTWRRRGGWCRGWRRRRWRRRRGPRSWTLQAGRHPPSSRSSSPPAPRSAQPRCGDRPRHISAVWRS